jgi:alpha-1,6-mannosyltransferase
MVTLWCRRELEGRPVLSEIGQAIHSPEGWLRRREERPRPGPRLVDTTMLYAPRSGGVKRYLSAKRAWLAAERPQVRHSLVVPGEADSYDGRGLWSIYSAPLPFGDGYRWPASKTAWMKRLIRQRPSLIEAGDPYTPGLAALRAGQQLGVPVIGFCHTDLAALAALHFGDWAERPVRRRWAGVYGQFDQVIAPSRYIAQRLAEAGVDGALALPLGVDVTSFHPGRADRAGLLKRFGLPADRRLLVFAGRPAREKKIEVLIEAVARLGDPYSLVLIGAGPAPAGTDRVIVLPYEADAAGLARLLASCDAFVHANDAEPFGLIVLEAMACGLPVVGPAAGGVAETVDEAVGQLAAGPGARAFAEAVEALFARDIAVLGARARGRAVARHGWRGVFERLCGIYARVSGDGGFEAPTLRPARH